MPTSAAVNANPCERIISLAVAEEGRGPDEVGQELTTYPYKLGNYLQPDEAWCSEFVSWIYRVAERPFTEGDEGGWMLKGSVEIRSWFAARQAFVSTTDAAWPSFAPQPGDYIRYNTDSGGHSGIVREVAGDTLYTVEGNVGNKVILRTIPDWRSYSPIDGIGRLGLTCGCSQDSECDDQNACTQDRCVEKSCQSTPITGCCTQDSQCDDQNSSTTDRCAEHACVHETAVGENTSGSSSAADDGSADDGSSVAEPSPRPQLEAPLAPTSPGNLVGGCSLSGQRHAHADLLFPLLAVLALARHRARRRPTR